MRDLSTFSFFQFTRKEDCTEAAFNQGSAKRVIFSRFGLAESGIGGGIRISRLSVSDDSSPCANLINCPISSALSNGQM